MQSQQGNMEALHFLYVRYAPDVFSHIRDDVQSAHEAEEVTQSVFKGLITLIEQYNEREEPFIAWLLDIAQECCPGARRP